jgi:hypothetical protein
VADISVAALRERHSPDEEMGVTDDCYLCGLPWPCDAILAAERIEALEAAARRDFAARADLNNCEGDLACIDGHVAEAEAASAALRSLLTPEASE